MHILHTIWLSCRIFVLLSIFGFYSFLYQFLCSLTRSRRKYRPCLYNLCVTFITNCFVKMFDRDQGFCRSILMGNSDILFESHGSQFLAFYFNRNMLCYSGSYRDFWRLHHQYPKPQKTFYQRRNRNNKKFRL